MKKLGHHLVCEATECNAEILNNVDEVVSIMLQSCLVGGAGILGHVQHQFSPQGVTVVVGLSESHASIHTWPEYKYAMLDVCTCGNVDPKGILEMITAALGGKPHIKEIVRGIPDEHNGEDR